MSALGQNILTFRLSLSHAHTLTKMLKRGGLSTFILFLVFFSWIWQYCPPDRSCSTMPGAFAVEKLRVLAQMILSWKKTQYQECPWSFKVFFSECWVGVSVLQHKFPVLYAVEKIQFWCLVADCSWHSSLSIFRSPPTTYTSLTYVQETPPRPAIFPLLQQIRAPPAT